MGLLGDRYVVKLSKTKVAVERYRREREKREAREWKIGERSGKDLRREKEVIINIYKQVFRRCKDADGVRGVGEEVQLARPPQEG